MRVTSIERRHRSRLTDVCFDGVLIIPVSKETLALFGLKTGDELSDERIRELEQEEARHQAFSSALRLLSYRPRSERELRDRLAAKRTGPTLIDTVIARLRELSLIDDEAFARAWVDSRDRHSPRGRRLIASELYARGVPRRAVEQSVQPLDDQDAAYRAGLKRARSLKGAAWQDFRRRLGDFLLRRGFGYETVETVIKRLYAETVPGAEWEHESV